MEGEGVEGVEGEGEGGGRGERGWGAEGCALPFFVSSEKVVGGSTCVLLLCCCCCWQVTTPVAIMTSDAKGNHSRISRLLEDSSWFGRTPKSYRLFR